MTVTTPLGDTPLGDTPLGSNHLGSRRSPTSRLGVGPPFVLAGAFATIIAAAALFHRTLPVDALVPGITTLFLMLAAGVAMVAWYRPMPARELSYWDVAGLLTLIGITASAAVEPDQVVRLISGVDRNP
jgi:hypothetical protein